MRLGDEWGETESCLIFGIIDAGTGDVDDVISLEPDCPSGLIGAVLAAAVAVALTLIVVSGELLRMLVASVDSLLMGVEGRSCLICISLLMTAPVDVSRVSSLSRSRASIVCLGANATFG